MSDDEDERNRVWAVAENITRMARTHYPSLGDERDCDASYEEVRSELTGRGIIERSSTNYDDGEFFAFREYCIEERYDGHDVSYCGDVVAQSLYFETGAQQFSLYVVEAMDANDARILILRGRPNTFSGPPLIPKPMMHFQRSPVKGFVFNEVFVDFQGDVSELEAAIMSLSL